MATTLFESCQEIKLSDLNILKRSHRRGHDILFVDQASATKILDSGAEPRFSPLGRFIVLDDEGKISCAIDNTDGCAWTEDFWDFEGAANWLTDADFDLESYYDRYLARHEKKGAKS